MNVNLFLEDKLRLAAVISAVCLTRCPYLANARHRDDLLTLIHVGHDFCARMDFLSADNEPL